MNKIKVYYVSAVDDLWILLPTGEAFWADEPEERGRSILSEALILRHGDFVGYL